jgi:hypothetical protein
VIFDLPYPDCCSGITHRHPFFFLYANYFGFNQLNYFISELVLAIGIVVDNAIVVVEAVHAKWRKSISIQKKRQMSAMEEIGGAIIATLVMSAVFIPVAFFLDQQEFSSDTQLPWQLQLSFRYRLNANASIVRYT